MHDIRVLVVDDDESMRATLMTYISRMGVGVRTAGDLTEAARLLVGEQTPFDIVLTDLRLPDGSGFDIVRVAHSRSSATLVAIITGYASLETAIEAIRLGAHDYITKPFSLDQIGIDVRNMIDRVTLSRENARLSVRLQELLDELNRLKGEKADLVRLLEDLRGEVRENGRKLELLLGSSSGLGPEAQAPRVAPDVSPPPTYFVPDAAAPHRAVRGYVASAHERGKRRGPA